jgi:hypothetical protein
MRYFQILSIPLLYLIAIGSVWITANVSGYQDLLLTLTQENGLFESLSVLWLFGITFYGIRSLRYYRFDRWFWWAVALFSSLTFVAGMEEISWGQQIFHFHSGDFFMQKNLQHETNLHNLVDSNLFSSIIYSTVYTLLVYLPLIVKLYPSLVRRYALLGYWDIDPHAILVVLFSSLFQIYFYDDFGVKVDMVSHLMALALFGYFLVCQKSSVWVKLHYLFILLATVISMASYRIYRFSNMQYEIREMFVVLASLLIFMALIKKEKR